MSEVHPNLDHEQIKPELQVSFEMSGDLAFNRMPRNAPTQAILKPIELALLSKAETLKRHCVIRDDIPYQEALDLTIWQGSGAFGMLRYPDISAMRTTPEYEIAEQVLHVDPVRRPLCRAAVGNPVVGSLLAGLHRCWRRSSERNSTVSGQAPDQSRDPARQGHGLHRLYQMQRPPTRVDIGRKSISAIYEGENAAASAALGLAEV